MSQPNLKTAETALHHLEKVDSLSSIFKISQASDLRRVFESLEIRCELCWCPFVGFKEGKRYTIKRFEANSGWLDHTRYGEHLNDHEHYIRG